MQPLPIDAVLPDIVASLRKVPRLVLEAPPGAGKTTRVPPALLEAGIAGGGEIVVLEPRRLATRMAARRVAEERGERVGDTIGYRVRFEDVSSARTRVRFVTEGVLTRMLVSTPDLRGVGCVVLDEFHERHLHGDVALALLRRLQTTARPDLALVAMSATLDAAPVAAYLDAPTIRSEGKRFDVAVEHLAAADDRPLASQVASAVRRLYSERIDGDVLVFLPGAAEIRRALETCEKLTEAFGIDVVALHGDLSPAEQDRAVRRGPRPKVILSTNVAESSVTVEGVVAVVDSGLSRVADYAPWSGLSTLKVHKVSRASATQRAGRAGRVRPGRCLRLYTKADHDARPEHDVPEIRRADLSQTMLELRASGAGAMEALPWLDAPRPEAMAAAATLLRRLGALDGNGEVTPMGRRMVEHPVHPRQARLLLEAEARGVLDDGCVLAALLSEGDLRASTKARFDGGRGGHQAATEGSDLIALLDLFREAEERSFAAHALRAMDLDGGATMAVRRGYEQLARSFERGAGRRSGRGSRGAEPAKEATATDADRALALSVLAAYPDRVARRVRPGGRALAMAGGGSAELSEHSVVRHAPWLVAVDAEERRGVVVRLASAIEPEDLLELFPERVEERDEVRWNASLERVEGTSRMVYEGLVLHEAPASGKGEDVARVLSEAALAAGLHRFAPEGELARWLARARLVATTVGGIAVPDDGAVRGALVAACEGKRSFAELRQVSLVDVLEGHLGGGARGRLSQLAPERVTLASGRTAKIAYEDGKPPWVEAHLQDFFGTMQTPRIVDGRVALVVHLLAPNKRAVQVTTDLAGFWERHYPAVRKELMRKYPRHFWPEEPREAEARLRVPKKT